MQKDPNSVKFLYEGERVSPNQTPEEVTKKKKQNKKKKKKKKKKLKMFFFFFFVYSLYSFRL